MSSSQQQPEVDELFDVKNSYYIGNYQQCINEANRIKNLPADLKLEKSIFVYRAYIAQKNYRIVLDEISEQSPVELQVLKLFAEYLSDTERRESILQNYAEKFSAHEAENHFVIVTAAMMYLQESKYEKVLQILHPDNHLESLSLALQTYLAVSRIDLARKELKKMQDADEDATLTQLAQGWIFMAMGRDKLHDAYYIFQEMMDKYGSSASLLNCQAVCYICQGKYDEAETALQEASSKDPNNPSTLVNSIVVFGNFDKEAELSTRYLSMLKESHGESTFVKDYLAKEEEFDRLCKEYAVPS